ncbi:MAG: acyltransferase [Planctomycetes bacterium]|nr:acyltransferase [Planctomycetota bacterium]
MSRSAISYEPSLDGLRAIAVLAVLVYHLDPRWLPGGFTGVDIFFVISGYLITRILLEQFDQGSFRLGSFYYRRVARIVPALAFVGFATLLAARFVYDSKHRGAAGLAFVTSITSLMNVKLCLQGNYFETSRLSQPFLHCWSLSLEEQFYLLYPLVLRQAWRRSARTVGVVLAAACGASLVAGIAATPRLPTPAFYLLPFRAWELLAGGLLGAWVWRGMPGARPGWARGLRWTGTAGLAGSITVIDESTGFPGWVALVPVVATVALIAATALDRDAGTWRWLGRGPMVLVGKLSYSLYLTHWPVCSLVDYAGFAANEWSRLPVKLVLIVIATLVLHAVVEAPARSRLLDARTTRSEATMLVLSLLIAIGVGLTLRTRHAPPGASLAAVASGGLVLNRSGTRGTVALVGDSVANQYLGTLERVCTRLGCRLVVLSVSGRQPIPNRSDPSPELWERSLAALHELRPEAIVFSCFWGLRGRMEREPVASAIATMGTLAPALVVTTDTPFAPVTATREAICAGSRPPYHEEPPARQRRERVDAWVMAERSATVEVIDVGSMVVGPDGVLRVVDDAGRYIYDDRGHFNEHGAALFEGEFEAALRRALGRSGE